MASNDETSTDDENKEYFAKNSRFDAMRPVQQCLACLSSWSSCTCRVSNNFGISNGTSKRLYL